ncbi:MAG: protein serine/threonine phosphatase 2C family protein [Verrucomicrobia bacterium]|nr:protein serine/threonine phosphatase 2C family protein [Verrucomicrobiota bacterium]
MAVGLNFKYSTNSSLHIQSGINFKFAVPERILQQSTLSASASSNPRLESSEGLGDLICRIWKAITDFFKSCFSCFGASPRGNSDCEYRVIEDEAQIRGRLAGQMQHAFHQMQNEPVKSFRYQPAPATWDMHDETVGGYRVGISHAQGRRPSMEDEHLAISFNLTIAGRSYPIQLFGIFDGHGGRAAAQYVRDNLRAKLELSLQEFNAQGLTDAGIWKALKMTTVRMNRDFKERFGELAMNQGTTATIAMILDSQLWTANVGDARTVLDNNGTALQLTEDAKPGDPRYKRGIEKRGGFVQINGVPRVNGDLAVARAIGDHRLNGAVSARPKITSMPLSEVQPGSHLILCCDGIYDVARTRDVVDAVHANRLLAPGALARNIVYSAYQSGSTDNLSAMVIKVR